MSALGIDTIDDLHDAIDRHIAALKACPYWEDGEHEYSERVMDLDGGRPMKRCACGATVKPRKP